MKECKKLGYIMDIRKVWGTDPIIMVGSGVIIVNAQGEILLQRRSDTLNWGLPGGSMEPGESLEETAVREVKEETGLIVEKLAFYRMFSGSEFAFTYPNGDQVYNVTAIYVVTEYSGRIETDGIESLELKFFSLFNLPEAFQETCKMIVDAYAADHFWIGV
jgi:8-oxo-dGTP pyrophosphatase MutT (NUDIX family)